MTETIFSVIFTALAGAVATMWNVFRKDHDKMAGRFEELDKRMGAQERELAVFHSCAAQSCPARDAIGRLQQDSAFKIRSRTAPTPTPPKS